MLLAPYLPSNCISAIIWSLSLHPLSCMHGLFLQDLANYPVGYTSYIETLKLTSQLTYTHCPLSRLVRGVDRKIDNKKRQEEKILHYYVIVSFNHSIECSHSSLILSLAMSLIRSRHRHVGPSFQVAIIVHTTALSCRLSVRLLSSWSKISPS